MKMIHSLFTAVLGLATFGYAQNIIDVANMAGTFAGLINAIQQAGLEQTLNGTGPYSKLETLVL